MSDTVYQVVSMMGNFTFSFWLNDKEQVCFSATGENITINRMKLDSVRVTFERRDDGSLYNAYFSARRGINWSTTDAAREKLYNFTKEKGEWLLSNNRQVIFESLQRDSFVKKQDAVESKIKRLRKELAEAEEERRNLLKQGLQFIA
jgi:DNA-binding response OmpR family regulator